MPRRVRVILVLALAVLLVGVAVVIAGVIGVRVWQRATRTDLQLAMAMAPSGAERFSFTDWADVRREVGADLDATSPYDDVADFLDDGFSADLTSASAMVSSAQVLQERFGFSPASVDWELFAQGQIGAAVMLQLPAGGALFDDLGDTLESLGYQRPAQPTGVWRGGPDVVARIGDGLSVSPEFQYVVLDADRHLVVTSDTADYADVSARAARGDGEVAGDLDELDDVVAAAGEALSAAVYTGDNACRELAMSQADDSDRAEADALIARAGEIDPLTGFAMAARAGGEVVVALGFASDDQARTNALTRARLAAGPAIGQGGDFADRFTLRRTTTEGRVVVLDLDPLPSTFVLSDLSTGPVLYATC